jgi:spore coat polysaccharide biosynthesis predicted glycosyltransferase SpsG
MDMKIVLAFDEGPGIGLGHRRRVEGLACGLVDIDCAVEMYVIGEEAVVGDVVLVDSYRMRADDRTRVRAGTVIAIDDLERDLAVDLVIDPDPGADARVHSTAAAVVAGAPYALVDPGLRALTPAPVRETVRRVLVTTGGADAEGLGARVAGAVADVLPGVQVRQVVGPWGCGSDDDRVEAVHAPEGLGPELAAADLVVTAGGVTMLEACCLGRPVVAFSIAPGQSRALAGAAQVGAVLAVDVASAAEVAARLAGDVDARRRLASSARVLVDGQGSARVAAVIAGMARHGVHVR